jgi:hypothetical protein
MGGSIRPGLHSLPVRYKAKHQKNREAHLSFSVFLNIRPKRKAPWSSRMAQFQRNVLPPPATARETAVGRTTGTGHHMRSAFWSRQSIDGTWLPACVCPSNN